MGLLSRLFSRDRPPASVLEALELGERVTSWALDTDGEPVVATTRGLWTDGRRLSWHEINKAAWDAGNLVIIRGVEVEPGVVADDEPLRIRLPEPRDLPPEVRTRVTRSVAYTAHHALPGGGVRIVARRVPGVDGLTWVQRFDEGTDLTDPLVRDTANQMLEQARELTSAPD